MFWDRGPGNGLWNKEPACPCTLAGTVREWHGLQERTDDSRQKGALSLPQAGSGRDRALHATGTGLCSVWIVQRLDCPAGLSGWIMQQDHAAGKSGRIRGCRIGADRGPGIQAGSLCAVSLFSERFLNVRLSRRHAAAGPGGVVSCARAVQKTASRGRSPFRLLPLSRAVPSLHGLLCRSQRLAPHGRIQERTAGKTGRTKKRRSGTAQGLQRPALWLPALRSEGVGTAGRSRYPGGSRRARGICCAR